ncbi:MAG: DUF4386 domain-containing protein [Rhizomicrobium sp.]
MDPTRKTARWAGLLYFLTIPLGMTGLIYVPSKLFVPGDSAATAGNIRSFTALLRLGIASELLAQIFLIYSVLLLFRLFRPVSETLARQLVVLGALVSAPILFVNVINEFAALILAGGGGTLTVFDQPQRDALAYLFMQLHGRGYVVAEIFWGLWLFPFGLLVIRSGFIPRLLGVALIIAGVGYVAESASVILLPNLDDAVNAIARLLELGELPIIFWLMVWGARARRQAGER